MGRFSNLLLAAGFIFEVGGQYFPPEPEGVTTISSKFHKGVKISYKEPGICETTPGVKSYAGYVHLPPNFLVGDWEDSQDYPINTFFWFFESRKDPAHAPLSIWLNGGPGGSSLMGALQENGPCFVGSDSNSTFLNPFAWNNEVNTLFIDQPVQVGFSYDVPTNCTVNMDIDELFEVETKVADFSAGFPTPNNTFYVGTMGSQSIKSTANSSAHAAHAIWHFAQTWFEEFPFYKPENEKISLWTESYGGRYGPAFTSFFQDQNEKIANGTITTPGAHYLHLDSLGIINGHFDSLYKGLAYLDMAFNNTYGIQAINESTHNQAVENFEKPGGCQDKLLACRKVARERDPRNIGDDKKVNATCWEVEECYEDLIRPYIASEHGWFDIAHSIHDPFPEPYLYGFLNQNWVQKALGVPVNFTSGSSAVARAFGGSHDIYRSGSLEQVAEILERGVRVALVYGDRDFACNWIGGERSVLAINYRDSEKFHAAGYTPIFTNATYVGGQVRQYGNLSFSRVYQSGHEVPSYQPETAYELFMRAMFNKDMATGLLPLFDNYQTLGPENTWHIKNEIPESPEPVCYILDPMTCTPEQWATVRNGSAIIENFTVVGVWSEEELGVVNFGDGDAQKFVGRG